MPCLSCLGAASTIFHPLIALSNTTNTIHTHQPPHPPTPSALPLPCLRVQRNGRCQWVAVMMTWSWNVSVQLRCESASCDTCAVKCTMLWWPEPTLHLRDAASHGLWPELPVGYAASHCLDNSWITTNPWPSSLSCSFLIFRLSISSLRTKHLSDSSCP